MGLLPVHFASFPVFVSFPFFRKCIQSPFHCVVVVMLGLYKKAQVEQSSTIPHQPMLDLCFAHTHVVTLHNINAPVAFPEEQPPSYQCQARDASKDDKTVERASPGQLVLCCHAFALALAQGALKGDWNSFMQDAASNAEAVTPLGGEMVRRMGAGKPMPRAIGVTDAHVSAAASLSAQDADLESSADNDLV